MLLSLLVVVLILALAFFQSTQGVYSALIMTALTICCAGLAFGTYEWVSVQWLAPLWGPDYSAAIALCALFGIPLLVIRLVADRVILRSPLLPMWIDRGGAALCGIVTAMITVGVMAHGLLSIPFGTAVIGFSRIEIREKDRKADGPDPVPPNPDAKIRELWFKPDRFAVQTASLLSDGLFSGSRSFRDEHPDVVEANAWVSAAASEVTRYAPPGSINVVKSEPVQFVYREIPGPGGRRGEDLATFEAMPPKDGHVLRMVRLQLKREAQDKRKSYNFTLRQVRLIGREGANAPLEHVHAIAIQQNKTEAPQPVNRHIRVKKLKWGDWPVLDDLYAPRADNNGEVEVVFEVPASFVPSYLEYKRGARAAVRFDSPSTTPPPGEAEKETAAPPPTSAEGGAVPPAAMGGNVRRYTTKKGASFFGDELPMPLKAYVKQKNVEIERGAMVSGHLTAFVDEQEAGKEPPVTKFQVDREKRLLHLSTGYLQAKSTLGKAMSFAVGTVQNYSVQDADGQQYEVIGKYAVADVDGRQVVEVQYFSNKAGTVGGMGPFDKIRDSHLKGDYEFVLLFLVDPGVQIVSFSTGGAANRRDDLAEENLVAPN